MQAGAWPEPVPMPWEAAVLGGLPGDCPLEIIESLSLVDVCFYDFSKNLRRGQLVVDSELEEEIQELFTRFRETGFPLFSVIPSSWPGFFVGGNPSDDVMMEKNNTSAFCYRKIAGNQKLSRHALGRALDINPMLNPWYGPNGMVPVGARFEPDVLGTLSEDCWVVQWFEERGWIWGGRWQNPDLHHFEKPGGRNG